MAVCHSCYSSQAQSPSNSCFGFCWVMLSYHTRSSFTFGFWSSLSCFCLTALLSKVLSAKIFVFHIIHSPAIIFSSSLEILTNRFLLDLYPGHWKFLVKIVCLVWVLHFVASSFGTVASSFPLACYAFASTFKVLLVARHPAPENKTI